MLRTLPFRFLTPARALAAAAIVAIAACDEPAQPGRFGRNAGLVERMLAAEDARAATEAALAPLYEGLGSGDAEVRRMAVRALGRMERSSFMARIAALLEDTVAVVRVEAANALAQAARGGDPDAARSALEARSSIESHPRVLGVIAESLGRLPHASTDAAAATALRLAAMTAAAGSADTTSAGSVDLDRGVARGLFFLARQPAARGALPDEALARLRALSRLSSDRDTLVTQRVRSTAAATLISSGRADAADLAALLDDAHPLVRREAAAALATSTLDGWQALAERAWQDPSPMVRYAVLRAFAREPGAAACRRMLAAIADPGPHVSLLAIDLSAQVCTASLAADSLDRIAAALPGGTDGWHASAHALAALARLDADRTAGRLPAFMNHPLFFVRAWAGRAATTIADTDALFALATDLHPNVRTEAVSGLARHAGHAADAVYIAQLGEPDSQLLQSAAAALDGSTSAAAVPALLAALERVTAGRQETMRDARAALLERIAQLGSIADSASLGPYLRDYDPAIADRAADILGTWTGTRPEPAPEPLPHAPVPPLDELERLAGARAILEMASGDSLELVLMPFAAPTNTARFARLARSGWFDGLTFHRIAPNFVVQGGSPNANEYAGDGPYSRDELVTEANWRGSVGLSTRGRDTGDAQLYINLIDNVRLDHDYTVFAVVVGGMAAVDGFLEGATIRSVRIR